MGLETHIGAIHVGICIVAGQEIPSHPHLNEQNSAEVIDMSLLRANIPLLMNGQDSWSTWNRYMFEISLVAMSGVTGYF